MSQLLDTYGSTTLNASGAGTVTLAPKSYETWQVTSLSVRTSQGVTQTPIPQVTVYLGSIGDSQIIAQSWMGNRATAIGSTTVQPSMPLIVRWENGVPGNTATVSVFGTMDMR